MPLIAVTGGIASGKSTVTRRLRELGAVTIDADAVAREVVQPGTPALAAIAESFGPAVIAADGTLDRAALGLIVFADEERRLALNAITHPAVQRRVAELVRSAFTADPDAIVVYDVPLLVEARRNTGLPIDHVVVVHADVAVRIERLVSLRGMSDEDAAQRVAAQAGDAERLAIADTVIDANGSLSATQEQVDALWRRLRG